MRDEEIETVVDEESQTRGKTKSRKRQRKKTNSESIAEEARSSDEIIISDVIDEDPKKEPGKKVKSKTQSSSGSKKNNVDNKDLEGKPDLKLDDDNLVSESTTDETDLEVRRAAVKRTKAFYKYNIQR